MLVLWRASLSPVDFIGDDQSCKSGSYFKNPDYVSCLTSYLEQGFGRF